MTTRPARDSSGILAAKIKPNLGKIDSPPDWAEILKYYCGSELMSFFQPIVEARLTATLKPQPPNEPRSSLNDISNGAAGLLSGKGPEAEVARLSEKIMDLMQHLQHKDMEHKRLEKELDNARAEAKNAKALLFT